MDLYEINDVAITIFEDNNGCIGMATNSESKRSKHIDIKHHFIRDNIETGVIQLKSISTKAQLADIFTKPLDAVRFQEMRSSLGVND